MILFVPCKPAVVNPNSITPALKFFTVKKFVTYGNSIDEMVVEAADCVTYGSPEA